MRKHFPHFPVRRFLFGVLAILALMASSLPVVYAAPGVPEILNYQGRLLDDTGNLLGNSGTDFCFRFSFYDDETVGGPDTKLWPTGTPNDMTVNVVNGVFSVGIGNVADGGDILDYAFIDDTTYLNIEVATIVGVCGGGDEVYETLSPRQQITSSAYSINSSSVFGTNQSAIGTTTAEGNALLTIEATSTTAIGLVVRKMAGQVSNLFSIISETAQSFFTIGANGNVGIGTTTPYAKLSVVGEVVAASYVATTSATSTFSGGIETNLLNITGTATSTFTNGIDLTAGCFSVNGSCLGGSSVSAFNDLTDVTLASESFGDLVRYDGVGWINVATSTLGIRSIDIIEDTNLFWTDVRFDNRLSATTTLPDLNILSGLASFGSSTATTTAEGNLHVLETLQVGNGSLFLTTNSITGSGAINLGPASGSDLAITTSGGGNFTINTNAFVVDGATGNIGIGTSSPYEAFSVAGNIVAGSFIATTTQTSVFAGDITTDLVTVSSTTATSTFANGITLSGGCVVVNGSCLSSSDDFNTFAELDTLVSDKLLVNLDDIQTFQSLITFTRGLEAQASSTLSSSMSDVESVNLIFEKSRGGGGISSGDELGTILFSGFDGGGFNQGATIEAVTEGTIIVGQTPTSLRFGTENLSGTFAERMRITPNGLVGIGSTTPYEALSVGGNIVANTFFADDAAATSTFVGLEASLLNITATNASSSFANGIDITGGCFSINGICTSSAIAYSNLTDTPSSITANAIQYGNSLGTALTQSSSLTFNGTTFTAPTTNLTGLGTFQSGFVSQASSTVDGDFTVTGSFALDVVNAASTTATSTFANGIRLSGGGCFEQADGTCLQVSSDVIGVFRNSSGGGNIYAATATTVPFDVEDRKDTGITHPVASDPSRIQLDEAGWYRISYMVVAANTNGTGQARANIECGVQANGSASFTNPSKSYSYSRGQYDEFSSNAASFLFNAAANDYIQVWCERPPLAQVQTPTMPLLANESWISIEKVGGQLGSSGGGGGGGSIAVSEGGASQVAAATDINFGGSEFNVTNAGGGQADIAIDYSNSRITRSTQSESITGIWSFLNASSTLFSVVDTLYIGGTATTTIKGDNSTSTFAGGIETDALNITSTSASSTFANGLVLNNGCVLINGICLGSDVNYLSLTDTPSSFSANSIQFANSGASGLAQNSNFVFDSSNGRLGIGLASPQGIIDLYSETDTDFIFEAALNTSAGPNLLFRKSQQGGGTISGDTVGELSFQAFDGLSYNEAASFDVVTEGTILVGQTPTSIRVSTEDLSGTYAERVRITPDGSFGIGTTSPTSLFSVAGDGYISGNIIVISTTTSGVLEITSTSASSTFANGLDITNGCFSVNGTCLGSSAVSSASDLSDVDTAGASFGNVLSYDGVNWVDTSTSSLQIAISDTTGTLSATRGGTGLSTIANNQILVGGPGNTVLQLATSSLGLLTTDVEEGSNLYWTDTRFDNRLFASTTVVNLYCSNGQVAKADGIGGWNCGADISGGGGGSGLWATSTDDLTQYPTTGGVVVVVGGSATTSTGFAFEVIGAAQFGNIDASGTLSVTGQTTLQNATSTQQTINELLYVGTSNQTIIRGGNNATSTFGHGIDVTSGCVAVNGVCIVSATNVSLNDIQDVSLSAPSFGNLLQYDGVNWIDVATSTLQVALSDTIGTLPVNRGGTGATTFSSGGFLVGNGTGVIGASSSPTVGWIVATSTTATSTFANGISIATGCAEVAGECLTTTNEYIDLIDTPSSLITNALQYVNAAGTALEQVATFVYDSTNGNLGIGTANPEYVLHTSSSTDGSVLFEDTSSDLDAADIIFRKSRGVGGIQTGDELGSLQFTGFDLGGNNTGASIDVVTEGSIAVGRTPASIRFSTDDLNGNFGERVRITPNGNFGIGTTSPFEKLSVAGGIVANYINATSTATSTFIGGIETNILNIVSTTATSTFANGIQLSNGCVSVNGTCLTDNIVYTGLTDTPSSLTANAIQYSNGGGTALTQSTGFTFNGTTLDVPLVNVTTAFGTSTFAGNIDVSGDARFSGGNLFFTTNATATLEANINSFAFAAVGSSTPLISFDAFNGRVGIGTTSPTSTLSVDGDLFVAGNLKDYYATIPLADAANTTLSTYFTESSIVGALNELASDPVINLSWSDSGTHGNNQIMRIHNGTQAAQGYNMPVAGEIEYISVGADVGPSTNTETFTVRFNTTNSSCVVSLTAGSTGANTTCNTAFSAGDNISVIANFAAGTSATDANVVVLIRLNGVGYDLAELYPSNEALDFGDIVSVDPENVDYIKISSKEYDDGLLSVISTQPGQLIGEWEPGMYPMTLSGRVPVKVNFEGGEIRPGDVITSSNEKGVGMKALKPGVVIGTALEGYTEEQYNEDILNNITGRIQVYVSPHWYGGDPERFADWFDFEEVVFDASENTEDLKGIRKVVYQVLKSFGFVLERGVATVSDLFADKITVKNADIREAYLGKANIGDLSVENSLQMTDQRTGKIFCMVLVDGVLEPTEGRCDSLSLTTGSDAPVITINGNNPAEIEVGSDYADLGAIVSDDRDNNLGMKILLNGVLVDNVQLDTNESTEYVITYRAIDNDGNTTEENRIVVVGEGNSILEEENIEDEQIVLDEDTEVLEEDVLPEDNIDIVGEIVENTMVDEGSVEEVLVDVVEEEITTDVVVETEEEIIEPGVTEEVVVDSESEPLGIIESENDV